MRFIKPQDEASFRYALKTIDQDVESGILTREQAHKARIKLKKAYSTGQVNRDIANASRISDKMELI